MRTVLLVHTLNKLILGYLWAKAYRVIVRLMVRCVTRVGVTAQGKGLSDRETMVRLQNKLLHLT